MNSPHDDVLNDGAQYKWSPEVQLFIAWFICNENKLPTTLFALSSCESITNVAKFYTRIKKDIAAAPNKINEGQLLTKLRKLKSTIEEELSD